jgi:hypothetical protein
LSISAIPKALLQLRSGDFGGSRPPSEGDFIIMIEAWQPLAACKTGKKANLSGKISGKDFMMETPFFACRGV